jgi:hypothetical protein
MKTIMLLALSILSILASQYSVADQLENWQTNSDNVKALFFSGRYAELNKIENDLLKSNQRTSSGLWVLTSFHFGIGGIPNSQISSERYWNDLESRAQKWIKQDPTKPAGYLAYAQILTSHAWMYRGDGYADSVRPEDWAPFHNYIDKAKDVLIKNKKIASNDPHWYVLMIDIQTAQSQNVDDFNQTIAEAEVRYPYYYQIYFSAVNYLTPKWHGSKEAIEEFANHVVQVTKHQDRNGMYARIYWVASQSNYGSDLFTKSNVVWPKMSTAMDDVLGQYPDQWNINNFSYFSCLAGDKNKTYQLIQRIKGRPILDAWKSIDFYNSCKAWSETGRISI